MYVAIVASGIAGLRVDGLCIRRHPVALYERNDTFVDLGNTRLVETEASANRFLIDCYSQGA